MALIDLILLVLFVNHFFSLCGMHIMIHSIFETRQQLLSDLRGHHAISGGLRNLLQRTLCPLVGAPGAAVQIGDDP